MTNIESKKISIARNLILIVLTFQISSCTGQVKEKSVNDKTENEVSNQPINFKSKYNISANSHQFKWNGKGVCKDNVSRQKRELLVWNKWKWDYTIRWSNT